MHLLREEADVPALTHPPRANEEEETPHLLEGNATTVMMMHPHPGVDGTPHLLGEGSTATMPHLLVKEVLMHHLHDARDKMRHLRGERGMIAITMHPLPEGNATTVMTMPPHLDEDVMRHLLEEPRGTTVTTTPPLHDVAGRRLHLHAESVTTAMLMPPLHADEMLLLPGEDKGMTATTSLLLFRNPSARLMILVAQPLAIPQVHFPQFLASLYLTKVQVCERSRIS